MSVEIELDSETQKIFDNCYSLLHDLMMKDAKNIMLVNMFANSLVIDTLLMASDGVYDDELLQDELECIRVAYSDSADHTQDSSETIH